MSRNTTIYNFLRYLVFINLFIFSIVSFRYLFILQQIDYKIPNSVHYVWYTNSDIPLSFHNYLSILSVHKFQNPDAIYFHTNRLPIGRYWKMAKDVPNFKIQIRQPPETLLGEPLKKPVFYTSYSNVDRVSIINQYGGIYLDLDTVLVRNMNDLRLRHECVIGQEQLSKSCGCVFLCKAQSPFLQLWLNAYLDDYHHTEWAYNSGKVPWKLWKRFPSIVYLEKDLLLKPNFKQLDYLYGKKTFNWQAQISIHLWHRLALRNNFLSETDDEISMLKMNSTFGQIARYIVNGETPNSMRGTVPPFEGPDV